MPATARLFINGKDVGDVALRSFADSWGFGDFRPNAAFAPFASTFGNWSLLMHADDGEKRLSEAASEELRTAEYAIDSLRAKLLVEDNSEWVDIGQLNIDGPLIEWKVTQRHASPARERKPEMGNAHGERKSDPAAREIRSSKPEIRMNDE